MRSIFLLVLVVSSFTASAQYVAGQSVEYTYDGAGNRILREPWDPSGGPSGKRNPDAINNQLEQEQDLNGVFSLFPNPTSSTVSIEIAEDQQEKDSRILVFSSVGETIFEKDVTAGTNRVDFDLSQFPSGIYFIQLSNGDFNYKKSVVKK